jgi:hypothetical protein
MQAIPRLTVRWIDFTADGANRESSPEISMR